MTKNHSALNPRDMVSGDKTLEEAKDTPPATRDGIKAAKEAISVATAIQGQLLRSLSEKEPAELDAAAVPNALLNRLDSISQKYSARGLKDASEEVKKQADGLRKLKGGEL